MHLCGNYLFAGKNRNIQWNSLWKKAIKEVKYVEEISFSNTNTKKPFSKRRQIEQKKKKVHKSRFFFPTHNYLFPKLGTPSLYKSPPATKVLSCMRSF